MTRPAQLLAHPWPGLHQLPLPPQLPPTPGVEVCQLQMCQTQWCQAGPSSPGAAQRLPQDLCCVQNLCCPAGL